MSPKVNLSEVRQFVRVDLLASSPLPFPSWCDAIEDFSKGFPSLPPVLFESRLNTHTWQALCWVYVDGECRDGGSLVAFTQLTSSCSPLIQGTLGA